MLAEEFLQSEEGRKMLREMAKMFDHELDQNDENGNVNT